MTTVEVVQLAELVSDEAYVERVARIAARIASAPDQPTVLALLREGTRALTAQSAVFISFMRDKAEISACRLLLACDPGWCRHFLARVSIGHDPWLAYAAHHSEPIVASQLEASSSKEAQTVDLYAAYGFSSVVLVPAHSGAEHSHISILCLGSAVPDFFEGAGLERLRIAARMLANELHDWWTARTRRQLMLEARLTKADLTLLQLQHRGYGSKRIAHDLHVSISAVNSHFQRLNNRLGVGNRKAAARLAAEYGLISD